MCPSCQAKLSPGVSFCDNCGVGIDPLLGRVLGDKYQLVRKIGTGGFGAVYEADEKKLSRKVAIKTLHAHVSKNPQISKRFLREAIAASRVEHPNIIKIYDYGETTDGVLWMAMEYLTGQSLDEYLHQKRTIPPEELLSLLRPVLEAIGEAHQKGLVHRDQAPKHHAHRLSR